MTEVSGLSRLSVGGRSTRQRIATWAARPHLQRVFSSRFDTTFTDLTTYWTRAPLCACVAHGAVVPSRVLPGTFGPSRWCAGFRACGRALAPWATNTSRLNSCQTTILRLNALGIEDALAASASPGSLLLELTDPEPFGPATRAGLKVLAAGTPALVDRHPAAGNAQVRTLQGKVLIPAMVNAHTHLDLTHIGPRPFDPKAGFMGFVDTVREHRGTERAGIFASVLEGAARLLAGGVVAVGDIAGAVKGRPSDDAFHALAATPLWGVSFVEYFGIGAMEAGAVEALARLAQAFDAADVSPGSRLRLGLQPHAPNTVSPAMYRHGVELARRRGWPLMTHVSETAEELEFIGQGVGVQRAFLEKMGLWEDRILEEVGRGRTPVGHVGPILDEARFAAVHVNYATDIDIDTLAVTETPVVYCPRASIYFEVDNAFGPHRYSDMMRAGIPVALGTDSIINLPAALMDDVAPWREALRVRAGAGDDLAAGAPVADIYAPAMSVLDEMRTLYRRDALDGAIALGMGTMDGAKALGLDPLAFTFKRGATIAGVVALEVDQKRWSAEHWQNIDRIMLGSERPQLLLIGK
jgi:cytosine/adenosine deaminase-related metal-dependent hydrolase